MHLHTHTCRQIYMQARVQTQIYMCSSADTDARPPTHTGTLTTHTHLLAHLQKCACVQTYAHRHTEVHLVTHTRPGRHSPSRVHLQMNVPTRAHRHKGTHRHRRMPGHTSKPSLRTHSQNQGSTGQLSASVPLTTLSKSLKAQGYEGK